MCLIRWRVSEIVISDVKRRDDGLYECQARNEGGKFFKSGHIQVSNTLSLGSKLREGVTAPYSETHVDGHARVVTGVFVTGTPQ